MTEKDGSGKLAKHNIEYMLKHAEYFAKKEDVITAKQRLDEAIRLAKEQNIDIEEKVKEIDKLIKSHTDHPWG